MGSYYVRKLKTTIKTIQGKKLNFWDRHPELEWWVKTLGAMALFYGIVLYLALTKG